MMLKQFYSKYLPAFIHVFVWSLLFILPHLFISSDQLSLKLKFLRSQISPHFIFNVLTNLVSLARKKSEQLEPALIKLAELMRYMLYESDEKKVNLSAEIEYLESYIELQKLRF